MLPRLCGLDAQVGFVLTNQQWLGTMLSSYVYPSESYFSGSLSIGSENTIFHHTGIPRNKYNFNFWKPL